LKRNPAIAYSLLQPLPEGCLPHIATVGCCKWKNRLVQKLPGKNLFIPVCGLPDIPAFPVMMIGGLTGSERTAAG